MTRILDFSNLVLRRVPTWPVYILCLLPAPYYFWLAITGSLGVEPIEALEHEYGRFALYFLIAGLCVTPLRRFVGLNALKFRRMLGLVAFTYVVLHVLVWALLDVQALNQVWADIIKRPYITVGMLAFTLMIPLAVTSNQRSLRKLGAAAWRKLHKLVYLAALLAALHFVMLVKGFQIEPLIYLAVVIVLVALRALPKRRKGQVTTESARTSVNGRTAG